MGRITFEEYASFIKQNQERAYRLAYGYLREREDALDAVQAAVERGLRRLDSLHDMEKLRPWFTRILVNECLDALRRRKRCGTESLSETAELAAPGGPEARPEVLAAYEAIGRLPPKLKTVVMLRFFEDMKLSEIAESTGCTLSTAKARLYKALSLLRLELEEDEEG